MKKSSALFLFYCTSFLLFACGGSRTNDPVQATTATLSIAVEEFVNTTALPTVSGFLESSRTYNNSVERFCGKPNLDNLQLLQNDWKALSAQWYKLAIYNFGPVNDDIIFPKLYFIDSLRQRGIDYTETVRTEIRRDINATTPLNTALFKSKDFNRVGLLALELLSFETMDEAHTKSPQTIVDEYNNTPRKCSYLKGMSELNVGNATYIHNGWQNKFLSTGTAYKTLFIMDKLPDDAKAVPTLLTSIQAHLDYLSRRNVATLGGRHADYTLENIKSSIDEINTVLNGSTKTKVSFLNIMNSAGAQNSSAIVKDNITAIYTALENKNIAQINTRLGVLDGNFKREIPAGLDVQLGINFSDGD